VFAAAVLLAVGETDARAKQGPAAPDPDKNLCPPAVPDIIRTLGYADDFIAEVCGIILSDSRLRDRINFRIVRDATLLADSENSASKPQPSPSMTHSSHRSRQQAPAVRGEAGPSRKPGDVPAGGN